MPEFFDNGPPKVFINGRELPGVDSVSFERDHDSDTRIRTTRVNIEVSEAVNRYVSRELTRAFQAAAYEAGPAWEGPRPVLATFDEVVGAVADIQARPLQWHEVPPGTPNIRPTPPTRSEHPFLQDANEDAKLCHTCGMWPEYHDHHYHNRSLGNCVCPDCMPEAGDMPEGPFADSTMANWRAPRDDES